VGPRVGLDMVSKRNIPSPCWELNPDHPIIQPIASRYTNRTIPALHIDYIMNDEWEKIWKEAVIIYHEVLAFTWRDKKTMKISP
jgi:hypothetical protein